MTKKAVQHPQQSANTIYIEVTQQDIDQALRNNSSHCAVAAAVSRQVDALRVSVDIQTIRMTMRGTNQRRIYLTPAKAQNYIIAYDAGDELKPFGFWMKRPAYVTHTRVGRYEEGDKAELVPAQDVDVTFRVADPDAEQETPAYVGLPMRNNRANPVSVPRQTRQATRREYGLRRMRMNQEYGRSDTKQYGKHRKVKAPNDEN